jgi:hypothetical protein
MILLIVLFVVIVGLSLLGGSNQSKILDEYCNLECKERKIKHYKFCC